MVVVVVLLGYFNLEQRCWYWRDSTSDLDSGPSRMRRMRVSNHPSTNRIWRLEYVIVIVLIYAVIEMNDIEINETESLL